MNARKRVHAQKPYSFQAFAHELSKVGKREEEIEKTEVSMLMERKAAQAAQQNKNLSEELKQGLPRHSSSGSHSWGRNANFS